MQCQTMLERMRYHERLLETPTGDQCVEQVRWRGSCWTAAIPVEAATNTSFKTAFYCRSHRWTKRGIAQVPTRFGCAFGILHLNQVRKRFRRSEGFCLSSPSRPVPWSIYTKMGPSSFPTLAWKWVKDCIRRLSRYRVFDRTPKIVQIAPFPFTDRQPHTRHTRVSNHDQSYCNR